MLEKYRELLDAAAVRVDGARLPETPGIYVFTEAGTDRYVGRTGNLRRRMADHRSSSPTRATLAVKMARIETERPVTYQKGSSVRDLLDNCPDFRRAFDAARASIRTMNVRWVDVEEKYDDGVLQAQLELHAAKELRTLIKDGGYNSFRNH